MATSIRGRSVHKPHDVMRFIVTTFLGGVFGFYLGVSYLPFSLSKMNLATSLFPSFDLAYLEDKYSGLATHALATTWSSVKSNNSISTKIRKSDTHNTRVQNTRIWVPTNPRGAERLPPAIVEPESDFFLRRLWGEPSEDLPSKPKYLVTFTVGYEQRKKVDKAIRKFSENFTMVLFHYDGRTSDWEEFEWSNRAIHISALKQTKWWFAKRFLHPDIIASYEYIFMWDEDLRVQNFNAEEYIKLAKKHGLEISQPGLQPKKDIPWRMTMRRHNSEVHKDTEEKPGWCSDPHLPPCAAFVGIMATVFSRDAWRCTWYMLQNDLIHGQGLDFALQRCVEPAHEKIGVVDAQWIVHPGIPSLGQQSVKDGGKAPREGVRTRRRDEWIIFQDRMASAERAYFQEMGDDPFNFTAQDDDA